MSCQSIWPNIKRIFNAQTTYIDIRLYIVISLFAADIKDHNACCHNACKRHEASL